MALSDIVASAEKTSDELIDDLRVRILLDVAQASSLTNHDGVLVRAYVRHYIEEAFKYVSQKFSPFLSQAFTEGFGRANSDLAGVLTPSHIVKNLATAEEYVQHGFASLEADIKRKVLGVLLSAGSGDATKEDVLDVIGREDLGGAFGGFAKRGRGIVGHEVETVERQTYTKRIRELSEKNAATVTFNQSVGDALQNKSAMAQARQLMKDKKEPLTIKVWRHSQLGQHPREWHEAMDGHGVPVDMAFRYSDDDGVEHEADAPHDPNLPISETANCRCSASSTVIYVTDDEKKAIYARAESTGGYADPRWA